MGMLDKLLAGGGVVVAGVVARGLYRDAQETKRRKSSPLCFDEGLSQTEFTEMAGATAERTPRVQRAVITGLDVVLHVKSNSGLSTWKAEIDFNDYGHLTGNYWLHSENSESLIPQHFAEAVRVQIASRVTAAR